jgi:hypothetical protein
MASFRYAIAIANQVFLRILPKLAARAPGIPAAEASLPGNAKTGILLTLPLRQGTEIQTERVLLSKIISQSCSETS